MHNYNTNVQIAATQADTYKCGHNKGKSIFLFIWIWQIYVRRTDFAGCLRHSPLQILLLISEISNKPLLLILGAETHISMTYFVNNPEERPIYSCVFQAS